jgi:hypothetical protein
VADQCGDPLMTQTITARSVSADTTVLVNGFQRLRTPATVELSRKESHLLEIMQEGYHTEVVDIRNVNSNMAAGNIIVGGLIGYMVDQSTGAAFRLVPEVVHVKLRPLEPVAPQDSAPAEEK